MLAQQPIEDSLKALKISNLENLISKILSISSKILPKVESKQDLITVVYDYNLSDIECVLTANDTLKENGLEIANPLIINATSIKETDAQLQSTLERKWT